MNYENIKSSNFNSYTFFAFYHFGASRQIVDLSGNEIGQIAKKWTGFVQEAFTDADVFGITFPMDLDVRMKAVLIGACMLIVSKRTE